MEPSKQVTEEVRQTTDPTGTTTEQRTVSTNTNTANAAATDSNVAGPGTIIERFVYFLMGALLVLLAFRFTLSLLGANKGNGFADFIYGASYPFVQPFFSLFNYDMQYGTSRVEFETLVAMAVYAVVGGGIIALIRLPRRTNTPDA